VLQSVDGNTFGRNSTKFLADAMDLMQHAIATDYLVDNAMLELNSLKFSCNATFAECRQVIVDALFSSFPIVDDEGESERKKALAKEAVDRLVLKWAPLLVRFTQGVEEQVALIDALQMACEKHVGQSKRLYDVVPLLYKADVIEEEAVMSWFEREGGFASTSYYVKQIKGFVQWLLVDEDDEEGSEDESEDEDGDEDSDADDSEVKI
jgi:translation initiation factor eIF-2B subunit epsilon